MNELTKMDFDFENEMIKALKKHAEGHIEKHCANVDIYLEKAVGIGEHSDVLEAIEKELEVIAKYDDELSVLKKYFT